MWLSRRRRLSMPRRLWRRRLAGAPPSCACASCASLTLAPRCADGLRRRRSVDLGAKTWERAVAVASAAAPATYAGTFKDDFGKLAGVIQYAHTVRRPMQDEPH